MSARGRLRLGCVLLTAGCAACFGDGASRAKAREESAAQLPPQVTLMGVRLHGWEGSTLVSRGRAAKLTYDRSSTHFEANEALMQFPSRGEEAALKRQVNADLELRAPLAMGNLTARQADGKGGVTVRSASGLWGETESAHFDGVGLLASGKNPVSLRGPGYSTSANGFTFYFATEELVFEGDVKSQLGEKAP